MDSIGIKLSGSSHAALIDQDITHIARVMRPSLHGDPGRPILTVAYWRKRLYKLLDSGNLSHAQLRAVDSFLLQLDRFEAEPHTAWDGLPTAAAAPFPATFLPDVAQIGV